MKRDNSSLVKWGISLIMTLAYAFGAALQLPHSTISAPSSGDGTSARVWGNKLW